MSVHCFFSFVENLVFSNVVTKLQVSAGSRGVRIRQSEEILERDDKTDKGNATSQFSVKSSKLLFTLGSYFLPR